MDDDYIGQRTDDENHDARDDKDIQHERIDILVRKTDNADKKERHIEGKAFVKDNAGLFPADFGLFQLQHVYFLLDGEFAGHTPVLREKVYKVLQNEVLVKDRVLNKGC